VAPYRNLKDRELARDGGRFIAEGEMVVRRLLASGWEAESVLVADERAGRIAPLVSGDASVYVAPHSLVNRIVGYTFHSGVMAVGRRKPSPSLEQAAAQWRDPVTLVICPQTNNTENLGAMIRIAAALGCTAMILGPRSADPFYRQSIRVSMGAVFALPIVRVPDMIGALHELRDRWGVQLIATVLADDAEALSDAGRGPRIGVLFGGEAHGLDQATIAACDRRVTIPMKGGIDSLNVAVSAGIVLHHFAR
jgi:tRNA G18 (ribose-2'-O)-methylase SpoU